MNFRNNWKKYFILCLWFFLHQDVTAEDFTTAEPVVGPQTRIVGGINAGEGQFPHQISLRLGGNHICGGSIISSRYVVTAAHCVILGTPPKRVPASSLTIRAGSRFINTGGQIMGVSEIKVHPSYKNFENDIALLKLSNPLSFNARIKPIALANNNPPAGSSIVISGWGRSSTQGPVPQNLQYVTLKAISRTDCKKRLFGLPKNVICLAHPFGKGACFGDSGGPAIYKNQLVGVCDFVVNGCGSSNPDGYASVANHVNWLRANAK
uniref:Peptidase S1 domain-containing protein n=1 Tax=Stomoxys calcitrans TaxID=35570 RepID=A0A1I8Q3Z7_STOCA